MAEIECVNPKEPPFLFSVLVLKLLHGLYSSGIVLSCCYVQCQLNVLSMINDHFVFQIDVNLKGGLGLSIVNSLPEELLYISLKNIMLMYRENSKAVTMEISVSNIQVNNAMKMSSAFVVVLVLSNIQKSSKGR